MSANKQPISQPAAAKRKADDEDTKDGKPMHAISAKRRRTDKDSEKVNDEDTKSKKKQKKIYFVYMVTHEDTGDDAFHHDESYVNELDALVRCVVMYMALIVDLREFRAVFGSNANTEATADIDAKLMKTNAWGAVVECARKCVEIKNTNDRMIWHSESTALLTKLSSMGQLRKILACFSEISACQEYRVSSMPLNDVAGERKKSADDVPASAVASESEAVLDSAAASESDAFPVSPASASNAASNESISSVSDENEEDEEEKEKEEEEEEEDAKGECSSCGRELYCCSVCRGCRMYKVRKCEC